MPSAWGVDHGVVSKARRTLRVKRIVRDAQDIVSTAKDTYKKGQDLQTKVSGKK